MEVKKMVFTAMFVALSVVGSFIKIPSPTGTVAFDSLPGYLAAALLGGWYGAIVGALGHLASAWTVSFPLGIPIALFIAGQMAIIVTVFGWLFRRGQKTLAITAGVLLNGVAAPATFIFILGPGIFFALLPSLLIASAANIIAASFLASSKELQKVVGQIAK